MRNPLRYALVLALFGAGCSGSEDAEGSGLSLSEQGEANGRGDGPPDITVTTSEGEIVLECERGGDVSEITVVFDCDEITVYSCKDLSNVVLELPDGSHHKSEGLNGNANTFSTGGAPIAGVWVKSGANHSGDGPGYGERFDAPEQDCDEDPPDAGSGCPSTDPDAPCGDAGGLAGSGSGGEGGEAGAGSEAGSGGSGDDPCADNDPDTLCGEGGAGGSDETVDCLEIPDDPRCRVD
jgi:hypothetical protein